MSEELTQDELGVDVSLREQQRGEPTETGGSGPSPIDVLYAYLLSVVYSAWVWVPYGLFMTFSRADAVLELHPELTTVDPLTAFNSSHGMAWLFHYHLPVAWVLTAMCVGAIYFVYMVATADGESDE